MTGDEPNPYAPPEAPTRRPPPTLVARGLAIAFGALSLGTWTAASGDDVVTRINSATTAVLYCLPMGIAAIVLGGNGVRRGGAARTSWLAIVLGGLGCVGLVVSGLGFLLR